MRHSHFYGAHSRAQAANQPQNQAQFEQIAEHYALPSVWMGMYALRQVQQGLMRWEEWLPDGLHPQERGSLSYAEAVIAYLRAELDSSVLPATVVERAALPLPLTPGNWEQTSILPWDRLETEGPWKVQRWILSPFMGRVLMTSAPGARLHFSFTGRGLALANHVNGTGAEWRWQIDDGPWHTTHRERPAWVQQFGWLRLDLLADDLPAGEHRCQIEVLHGDRPECSGTNCHLVFIGIIG